MSWLIFIVAAIAYYWIPRRFNLNRDIWAMKVSKYLAYFCIGGVIGSTFTSQWGYALLYCVLIGINYIGYLLNRHLAVKSGVLDD